MTVNLLPNAMPKIKNMKKFCNFLPPIICSSSGPSSSLMFSPKVSPRLYRPNLRAALLCTGCINISTLYLGYINQAMHQGVTQKLGSCVKGADKTAPDQPVLITS